MICKKCKKEVDTKNKFCPYCGNDLSKQGEVLFCSNCFELIKDGAEFCEKCGTAVDKNFTEEKMLKGKSNKSIYEKALLLSNNKDIKSKEKALLTLTEIKEYPGASELSNQVNDEIVELNQQQLELKYQKYAKIEVAINKKVITNPFLI
jgi:RNA polymerase subunit RPABC4/transcription elongation factor Spt4